MGRSDITVKEDVMNALQIPAEGAPMIGRVPVLIHFGARLECTIPMSFVNYGRLEVLQAEGMIL